MHQYAAFIGHQPLLSKAELSALLPDIRFVGHYGSEFVTFTTNEEIDQDFLSRLGGTILIAKHLQDLPKTSTLNEIPHLLIDALKASKGKVTFSLRFFQVHNKRARDLFRESKQALKQRGVASRYVGSEHEAAKAIQLHDQGVLNPKKGAEIMVLRGEENFWVGVTVAAQDVKAYTLRDMEKPVRDLTVGLLPPKLAQMMLNFGEFLVSKKMGKKPKKLKVFDPFCGTGVIPLECLVRGWDSVASDIEIKAVNGCRKNIEWARKTFKIFKKDVDDEVYKHDATKPFEFKKLPDAVVTEGTLGPTLKHRPMIKDLERLFKNAEKIEEAFLRNCKATLPGVPVVMMWPAWYTQKRPAFLEKITEVCKELGYSLTLPPYIAGSIPGRHSLVYRRPDQFVGREIVMLMPGA